MSLDYEAEMATCDRCGTTAGMPSIKGSLGQGQHLIMEAENSDKQILVCVRCSHVLGRRLSPGKFSPWQENREGVIYNQSHYVVKWWVEEGQGGVSIQIQLMHPDPSIKTSRSLVVVVPTETLVETAPGDGIMHRCVQPREDGDGCK